MFFLDLIWTSLRTESDEPPSIISHLMLRRVLLQMDGFVCTRKETEDSIIIKRGGQYFSSPNTNASRSGSCWW